MLREWFHILWIRIGIWRRYWRLLLAVKLCEVCMGLGARPFAERWAPIVGGRRLSGQGLQWLLDAMEGIDSILRDHPVKRLGR